MKKSSFFLLIALATTLLFGQASVFAEPDEPLAPASSPNWESNQKISQSNAITGAILPSIAASNNGSKLIVVYQGIINGENDNHDVFYTTSTDFGENWPTKARIHQSSGVNTDSTFVDIAISPNDTGHAVWREEVGNVGSIVYKNENNWGNNTTNLVTISAPAIPVVVSEPRIVAKNNNRLDIVWSQGEPTTNVNIYHAYSTNGGGSWQGVTPVADTSPSSRLPDIAIDANGVYHLVWEEGTNPTTVYYLRGTPSGGLINWSTRINISQRSIPGNATSATQPKIIVNGNTLHVAYTNFITKEQQYVHHLECSNGCANSANWLSTNNPVSGQLLGAKASDPFDVISGIAYAGHCTFVYFHGIQGATTTNNERLWGVNSCGNWAASARDQVTESNIRAINPALISGNKWWLYLAYEQVSTDSTLREVYFVRNQPEIYLPVVVKN